MAPVRILIAEDSAFLRLMYVRRLSADPSLEIVGVARDGNEAVALAEALRPDVITMDVEMPGCDGLSALAQIMAFRPTPVIMVSSLTSEGADTTIRALTLGAVDFIVKPTQFAGNQEMLEELAGKIKRAAAVRVQHTAGLAARERSPRGKGLLQPLGQRDAVIIIGSSTGGPSALRQVMSLLPCDLNAAGVIVQHMPAGFTTSLAKRLDDGSAWHVREAWAGDALMRNRFLLAPGGRHLVFDSQGRAQLSDAPPVHAVRPAVDVTMRSLAELYRDRVCAAVLTGMGRDGTAGALFIREAGGRVVAEAESTCAVYGMPRSAVEAGAAECVAPLPEIPALLVRLVRDGHRG